MQAHRAGEVVRCAYCNASCIVEARQADTRAKGEFSRAEELARVTRLRSQLGQNTGGHAYDVHTPPPGLEGMRNRAALEQAWRELHTAPRVTGERLERRRLWLAVHLAEARFDDGDDLPGRAVLESALDELRDPDQQHIIRCRLAYQAAHHGEVSDAEALLAECDPAPELLELDSELRLASARVALARGDFALASSLLGKNDDEVPLDPDYRPAAWALRVAHAMSTGADPKAVLAAGVAAVGDDAATDAVEQAGFAPELLEAHRRHVAQTNRQAAEAAQKVQRKAAVILGLSGLAVVGLIGFTIYQSVKPPPRFPIRCHGNANEPAEVVIDGEHIDTDGWVVRSVTHCRVIVRNATIRAEALVSTQYPVEVEVSNSTITTTDTAIWAWGNWPATVEIDDSTITNEGSQNPTLFVKGELVLRRCIVRGRGKALEHQGDETIEDSDLVDQAE